jgi:MFS family permease
MLSEKFRMSVRDTLTNTVLLTNAFVWYYLAIKILYDITIVMVMEQSTVILMWCAHFAAIIFSAIIGAWLANKVRNRTHFLAVWMILGIASSAISILMPLTYVPNIFLLSVLLGVSLGIGMPTCMGYFTETMQIEHRGRVGGAALLLSGVTMAAIGTTPAANISLQTSILSAWRLFGLIFFLLFTHKVVDSEKRKSPSYRSLFGQRNFILYLVPWGMFSLITYLTIPIQDQILAAMQSQMVNVPSVEFLRGIENVLAGISAVVGGFLSDLVGRKRMAIGGFAALGVAYSVLGIYPQSVPSWYFYTIADGVALGLLYALFVVTVWGDLGDHLLSDKYYAIGVAPFFISKALQFTIGPNIAAAIPQTAIFSFTALFLFLGVLPLVYAPETLPEKIIKERELKTYLEKAQKIAAKPPKNETESKQCENKDEDEGLEFQVNQEDDEKARELAEKYY